MPYRDRATVKSWMDEFSSSTPCIPTDVSVLEIEGEGDEAGLVAVSLRNASTLTYIQPTMRDGSPTWIVTFEARSESFDLDAQGVARLSEDLATIARICAHLQKKTDDAVAAQSPAGVSPQV